MKIRIVIVIAVGLLLILGPAAAAKACFHPSPTQGQPGSTVMLSINEECVGTVIVWFDGAEVAEYRNPQYGLPFSFSFTIPTTATTGRHYVSIAYGGHTHGYCNFIFTVDAATQPAATVPSDAYPETTVTPTSLPSTGLMLFLPTAGLLGGGLGMLLLRKRRR